MERNIPDVRDIFGRSAGGDSAHKQKQELRSYDYSPRSRRRHEAMDSYDNRVPSHNHHSSESRPNLANKDRKNNRHRSDELSDPPARQNKKSSDDHQRNASSKSNKDAAYYANRTLTERDIRHLERHLSMKKTIRKQISRNLAQAFVDDPELALTATNQPPPVQTKSSNKVTPDRTFTLTRAKVSKSEQNVLDLLKDNEPDSGHCSADNPNSSDDDSHQEQVQQQRHVRSADKACHNSRSVPDSRNKADVNYKDDGKFSFWKMFSVKNRGKR